MSNMHNEVDIPLHGPSVTVWERCKSFLNNVLQNKFGCMAYASGGAFEGNQAVAGMKTPTPIPKNSFETLVSNVKVSVHKADLSNFPVDAVVNAANEHLHHQGGIALALARAGGPQIQKDSDDYIRKNGDLTTGEAVAMDPGLLPCKKIIHAVGPYVRDQSNLTQASSLLANAVFNSLQRAEECHLKSVALPAISSGLFGYPLPQCAATIVRTVRGFCEEYPVTYLKEILLVNNDDPTVAAMENACRQIFYANPASSSAGSKPRNTDHHSTNTVQLGTVCLTLKWGRIEDEQTDVIVNTTSKDDWDSGQISSAILKKAGQSMTKELERTHGAHHRIITTGRHNLHCAEVYHTFCTSRTSKNACQILSNTVSECLELAATKLRRSIAFPAIGTGSLGFRSEDVAHIMSEAVLKFSNKCSKQMEVYFVIFPSDHNIFKAFKEKMTAFQQIMAFKLQPTRGVTQHGDDFNGSGASTAKIRLSGPSVESVQEAYSWLNDILLLSSKTKHVQNNFITYFGEERHLQLTKIMLKNNVSFEVFLIEGQASIMVTGNSRNANLNVAVAFLEVENLLFKIQREFVEDEAKMLSLYTNARLWFRRNIVSPSRAHFSVSDFHHEHLKIVKVENIENPALEMIFNLKKKQLKCSTTQKMLQRIPAHFCDVVSFIGFQAELAPPDETAQGQGIYFTSTVSEAMHLWSDTFSEYQYFVEAEVLTGASVPGKPDLILPPPLGADPLVRYDSISGGRGIVVISTGYQALPVNIITCKKVFDSVVF